MCIIIFLISPNDQKKATDAVFKLSMEQVRSSGDNSFLMKGILKYNNKEDDLFKKYALQLKQECSRRLLEILYHPEWGTMDLKFWLAFSKKKFLKMDFN